MELHEINEKLAEIRANNMEEALRVAREEGFKAGARAACEWLEEVYGEGIQETDAWAEYVGEEE